MEALLGRVARLELKSQRIHQPRRSSSLTRMNSRIPLHLRRSSGARSGSRRM
jgi:hypothetical protein